MKLNQDEKNKVYYTLLDKISNQCENLSNDVYDHHMEYVGEELSEIRESVNLLDKLGKDGWAFWESEE